MNSFEFNKIAGGILGTALFVMAIGIVAEIIYEPEHPDKPGYVIAVVEPTEPGVDGKPPVADVPPIAVRLAHADLKRGESAAKICLTCHTLEKGQPKKVGPNLWGVVGAEAADVPGFDFSPAMLAMKAAGKAWTFEELDAFLAAPQKHLPRTFMTFPGEKDPQKRADLIALLANLVGFAGALAGSRRGGAGGTAGRSSCCVRTGGGTGRADHGDAGWRPGDAPGDVGAACQSRFSGSGACTQSRAVACPANRPRTPGRPAEALLRPESLVW